MVKSMVARDETGFTAPSSSQLNKPPTCGACGTSFLCEISLGSNCWCSAVELNEKTLQKLQANFIGCLCPACLGDLALPEERPQKLNKTA